MIKDDLFFSRKWWLHHVGGNFELNHLYMKAVQFMTWSTKKWSHDWVWKFPFETLSAFCCVMPYHWNHKHSSSVQHRGGMPGITSSASHMSLLCADFSGFKWSNPMIESSTFLHKDPRKPLTAKALTWSELFKGKTLQKFSYWASEIPGSLLETGGLEWSLVSDKRLDTPDSDLFTSFST